MRRKRKIEDPNEVLFGNTTRADLYEIIYSMLSVMIHNNRPIPGCYRHSKDGGIYSEGFAKYEAKKFGFALDKDEESYNFDI